MPGRGRGSFRTRGGRGGGGGRGRKTGRPSNGASTSRRSTGRPWDDSDSDGARPDFYSESDHSDYDSDDMSPRRVKKTVIRLPGLEDEADDVEDEEEMSEAGSYYSPDADESSQERWSESRKTPTPDAFVCPWVEAGDSMPPLTLPPSSDDLLLPSDILFDALEIYEVCRTFYSSIKLSPFLFEDMCAALLAQEQSRLLAEMHINLLKLLLKDDEDEQIVFCPTDMNNTANIVIHLLEPMTYAEVLRQYIESDPVRFPADVLAAVSSGNYPFVPIRQRLKVLGWLCDRFLQSGEFRRIVRREGRIEHDEHCRDCGKPGNVILCDGCEACYHLACTDLKAVPDGQWLCGICQLHKVVGVYDCNSPLDRSRQPIRQEPIGFDRHGRRYWFLVRRVFVQDENTGQLWYYSTLPQFRQLCALLDPVDFEWRLCAVFQDILAAVVKQMRTTMSLTAQMKTTPVTCLGADNRERMREIRAQLEAREQSNLDEEDEENSLVSRIDSQLGVKSGIDSLWMGLEDESSSEGPPPLTSMTESSETTKPKFRLGQDTVNGYRKYVNQYSTSDYAKTPYARAKERDRTKYMSNKFSLIDEGAFEWPTIVGKDLFGSTQLVASLLQWSMNRLLQKIPVQLMHRRWQKEGQPAFKQALESANTPELLREQLMLFENCMRRCLLSQVWQDTLGHTKLLRCTSEDREWRQKIEKKRKADEKALVSADPNDEDSDVVWVKYTKLNGPPKHNLWKLKDEQYRVNGLRELGGWMWVSTTKTLRLQSPGPKPPLGITATTQDDQLSTPSARKAHSLEVLMAKLMGRREDQYRAEVKKRKRDALLACYSPSCRRGQIYSLIAGPSSNYQQCYSAECRRRQKQFDQPQVSDTRGVVKIAPGGGGGRPLQRSLLEANKPGKLGVGEPYPLPKPFKFISKSNKSSVLAQPPVSLKRMARQAGVGTTLPLGFSTHSKSNTQVWPYPCQRPLFETCWRYLTQNAKSFHAVALQLRILHACVRWADMSPDTVKELRVTIHHDDHDEIREVIGHLELPPSGLTERYKLRVQLFPLDDEGGGLNDDDQNDPYYSASPPVRTPRGNGERKLRETPALKKTTKRFSQPPTVARPMLVERWANGPDLKLSEIRNYWVRYERDARARSLQLQRPALTPVSAIPGKAPTIIARQSTLGGQSVVKRGANVLSMGGNGESASTTTGVRGNRNPLILSGGLRGGGKFNYVPKPVKSSDGMSRVLLDPATMLPRDDQSSPLSSNVRSTSTANSSPIRVVGRGGSFTGGVRPIAGKLLMIRRADGTTQLLRPVTTVKPEERVTAASLTAGGGGEARGVSVASLDDHAGMAQQARPIASRGRPPLSQMRGASTATRFIRVQGTPSPAQTQPMRTTQSVRGIRVQTGGVEVRDPFMARMAGDDDAPTLTPAFGSPTVRRRGTGDTYAGYYGEKSNDRIDIDEYQQLAERGFRPPGRPPGRLASTFGYGPQASSSAGSGLSPVKPIKVMTTPSMRGRGRGGRMAATTVIGPDFRSVTKLEPSPLPTSSKTAVASSSSSLPQEAIVVHSAKGAYMIANPPANSPRVRRVTSYKEYCQQNGMEFKSDRDTTFHSRPVRPPRFEFETNEEEERAIAEAIAREEELMRIEEESKGRRSYAGREADFQRIEDEILRKEAAARREIQVRAKVGDKRPPRTDSALRFGTPVGGRDDKSDTKICRQVLDSIVAQVCRLDKQYGWSRQLTKNRPRDRKDYDRQYRARKAMQKAVENVVSERIDRLRKEVCKRRLDLEKRAEVEAGLGISTWRKGGKPRPGAFIPIRHGGKRPQPMTASVIDPSQISLTESSSPPPAKKARVVEEASIRQWQPPKTTPSLAAAMAGTSRKEEKKKQKRLMARSPPPPSAVVVENGDSGDAPPPTTIDPTKLHCICRTPYDPTKFYVGCDLCYRWYHGKCIGISEKKAKKINSYTCTDCSKEQAQTEGELYCVCRTPYNDAQFYVGCDGCEGWFHPACVGITQAEAERASEYICPNCQGESEEASTSMAAGPSLTRADYPLLWRLLESLTEHRTSWPFREPVDVEKYPNYYKIVKEPMDLSRVQRKLDDLEYHRLQDFIYDIGKIFDNARLFNPKDSPISQCADILEKRFRENLQLVKEEMSSKQRDDPQGMFGDSSADDSFLDEAIDVDY